MPRIVFKALLAGMLCCFFVLSAQNVSAQSSEIKPDEPAVEKLPTAPTEQSESDQAVPQSVDLEGIDLLDPAIRDALEAREAADKAIIDAVLQQRSRQTDATTDEPVLALPEAPDMDNLQAKGQAFLQQIFDWLKSPKFLAQIGAIILAFFLAPIIASQLRKRLFLFRDAPSEETRFRVPRSYIYRTRDFLRAAAFIGLLALFAVILKAIPTLGEDWLVKLCAGIATVFLLFKAIKEFVSNDLFRKLAIWILIPLALLAVFGYFDEFLSFLDNTPVIPMDPPVTAMTIVRLAFFGALFFWLGNFSNDKGQTAIRSQEGLDLATREVVAKLFQMILFVIVVVLIMSFAGIPLSGLVMVVSAIGLGIGLGLQPVAANFVSGIIILFDRSVRKGDFVVLPDGQEGYVEAINMRSTTVETTDGKDIMVPNTTFIENTYENWTHTDPAQRYEVYFGVSYDTDIDKLEEILIPAIAAYPKVLMKPEEPDLELREFGEFSIKFAIEFWVSGIDDGENKFTSDLNYIVWRTLKENGITMPLPQREIRTVK